MPALHSVPMISAIYAALLGLLGATLTANVIVNRVRLHVDIGDGGIAQMAQAIRAHANFAEQVPLALLLILIAEVSGTGAITLHILGVALVIARVLSALGLSRSLDPTMPRQLGAGLTILVTVATAALILYNAVGAR